MAEGENEEVDVDETNVDETNVDETKSNEESDNDSEEQEETITWEQAQEWKRQAQGKAKAESKLVELKRQLKESKTIDSPINSKEEVKKILAEEKFYDKNPEAEAYRNKIENYQGKGLSLEEAYFLASKQDKNVEENRNIYGKSIVKGNTTSTEGIKTVSVDEYDRMTDSEQSKYNSNMKEKYGVVKFK